MASINVNVNITGTEEFNELLDKFKVLVNQVETDDYKNSKGHYLKMNSAYIGLKEFIAGGKK